MVYTKWRRIYPIIVDTDIHNIYYVLKNEPLGPDLSVCKVCKCITLTNQNQHKQTQPNDVAKTMIFIARNVSAMHHFGFN